MARRVVELLFGRLDGRTASFAATRDLIERYFPGDYEIIRPGADLQHRPARKDGPPEIVFSDEEERGALRLFVRALRRLQRGHEGRLRRHHDDAEFRPHPLDARHQVEPVLVRQGRVVAAGDSYNDTAMLGAADAGFFIHPPASIVAEFPQFPVMKDYRELRAAIDAVSLTEQRGSD